MIACVVTRDRAVTLWGPSVLHDFAWKRGSVALFLHVISEAQLGEGNYYGGSSARRAEACSGQARGGFTGLRPYRRDVGEPAFDGAGTLGLFFSEVLAEECQQQLKLAPPASNPDTRL